MIRAIGRDRQGQAQPSRLTRTGLAELREASTRMETALAEMNDVLGGVVDRLEELGEKE